ncbi:hypothetical protein ABKN59_007459 [Abortiporus biennis]
MTTHRCQICRKRMTRSQFVRFHGRVTCGADLCLAVIEIFERHHTDDSTIPYELRVEVQPLMQSCIAAWSNKELITPFYGLRQDIKIAQCIFNFMQELLSDQDIWVDLSPIHTTIRSRLLRLIIRFWSIKGDHIIPLPDELLIPDSKITINHRVPCWPEGSCAFIWSASYENRQVVLKNPRYIPDCGIRKPGHPRIRRLYRELLMMRNLDHPNIIKLIGFVQLECYDTEYRAKFGTPCLVLPRYMHSDVRQYLREHPVLPANHDTYSSMIHRWIYEMSVGLDYLHSQGVAHGDLRAGNIFVKDDLSGVVLADFGMAVYASDVDGSSSSSRPSSSCWLAPELLVLDSNGRQTKQGDIWAFGCVCIEMYTGQDPLFADKAKFIPEVVWYHRVVVDGERPPRPMFHGQRIISIPRRRTGSHAELALRYST